MIKLTFKVNGLKTLGDLPPQGRAAVLNAAAGRFWGILFNIQPPFIEKAPFSPFCAKCAEKCKNILLL